MFTTRRSLPSLFLSACTIAAFPHTALSAVDNATLTVGQSSASCFGFNYGYQSGVMGAYSNTALTGGKTVVAVGDKVCFSGGGSLGVLTVSGFTSDPGRLWLNTITCAGWTNWGTTSGYYYNAGIAQWTWSNLFGFVHYYQSAVSCSIDHS